MDSPKVDEHGATQAYGGEARPTEVVRQFQIEVVEGVDSGRQWMSSHERCAIGSHQSNDLVLTDLTVSRFHLEINIEPHGARIRDLESLNGSVVDGVHVNDAFLRGGSLIRLGKTVLRFGYLTEVNQLPLSSSHRFGSLIGHSAAMRACFTLLERAACTDMTVLLEGETGTGKEGAAESIHAASARNNGPFIILDCGAIPPSLIESELFGHEKGAFTGATNSRVGAFEAASGGTLFLDEIGELPLELQPKLLRALEGREIRPLGSNHYRTVDVRVIAATHRDLRGQVNGGKFRSDLYYRIAVVRALLPALRKRPEDIRFLAEHLLERMALKDSIASSLREPSFLRRLERSTWPGNVRELRNYLERCVVFEQPLPVGEESTGDKRSLIDASLTYAEARKRALALFENDYISDLLERHKGDVTCAARVAGIDRAYLYRLIRRHRKNER